MPQDQNDNQKKIPLVECFGPTIQGEGMMIGCQTYFLRFGLCDYKCTMCDSMHAVDPASVKKNAKWLTQHEIVEALERQYVPNSTKWVTFSGGNPCIHELTELCVELHERGWKIAVETQGTFNPHWLQLCSVVTVSPKGPGMGEKLEPTKLDTFVKSINPYTALVMKIVVFDQRDLETARSIYDMFANQLVDDQFYLSLGNTKPPGKDEGVLIDNLRFNMFANYELLFDDIKKDPILSKFHFLPQLHALIWGNRAGV